MSDWEERPGDRWYQDEYQAAVDLENHRELCEALCSIESGLTPWEVDFVESIAQRTENGQTLTPKQKEIADGLAWEHGV